MTTEFSSRQATKCHAISNNKAPRSLTWALILFVDVADAFEYYLAGAIHMCMVLEAGTFAFDGIAVCRCMISNYLEAVVRDRVGEAPTVISSLELGEPSVDARHCQRPPCTCRIAAG